MPIYYELYDPATGSRYGVFTTYTKAAMERIRLKQMHPSWSIEIRAI